jgi:nucleoside recognition membrane protein YjiH
MYYSPEGLLRLFLQFCLILAFIYPGYLIVNGYFKRKGEDTSLPGNYEKTIWGGFLVSAVLAIIAGSIYRYFTGE